jgi:hypothetical protein
MTSISLEIKHAGLTQALQKSPEVLTRHLRLAVLRILMEIARQARSSAPKAFSTLTYSINQRMIDDLSGEVRPHVDYARMVEEGTGPGGFPPEQSIVRWIAVKGITPRDPAMSVEDLAYAIARSIALHGTQKQPYLMPAANEKKARANVLFNKAVDDSLQEMAA